MAEKRKKSIRRTISNALIICGAVLIVIGVSYEAATYPWRILLTSLGISVSDELPDPAPLPEMHVAAEAQPTDAPGLMPSAGLFELRPELNLTKVGIIQLPKIGISENIVEGTGNEMLYAVGHMRGTPMPGEDGNCVLAAHRDYVRMNPFKHLDKIQPGDEVRVRTEEAVYIYRVYKNFIVQPSEVWVTEPQEGQEKMLTLLTCTPVLTSTHRMVVWASLEEVRPLPQAA